MTKEYDLLNKTYQTSIGNLFIKKKLGEGKSGYSYLAEFENQYFVLKLMHNEPCHYYSFGDSNKVVLEVYAYHKLKKCGILLPELIAYDAVRNYLIKEFIEGYTASELIVRDIKSLNQ